MPQKSIYLSDETYNMVKNEGNLSQIADKLLKDYYQAIKDPKQIEDELNAKMLAIIEEKKQNQFKIEKKEKRKDMQLQEMMKEKPKNDEDRFERMKPIQRECLERYDIPPKSFNKVFNEFFNELKEGKVANILEYVNKNKIVKKPKRKLTIELD